MIRIENWASHFVNEDENPYEWWCDECYENNADDI